MSGRVLLEQINSLITLRNDKSKQLKSIDYQESGLLPIVDQGAALICGYTNNIEKKYDKGLPVIIFGDHTLHTKFIDFDFAIGADGTQIIVPSHKSVDSKYLFYLILRATEIIGSEGYKRHLKILKEFYTPFIADQKQQQKIAKILTSVDEVIETTETQINKLKDLKKGMMNELLTKGIGHTEFKDSAVGRIPVGWEVVTVGKVAGVVDSMHQTPIFVDVGMPMVRVTEIRQSDHLDISNAAMVSENTFAAFSRNYQPKCGDTLIARVGAYFGATSFLDKEAEFCLGQNTASIRPKEVCATYLFYILNSKNSRNQMNDAVSVGAQPSLSLKAIKNLFIFLPPPQEQHKIAKILSSIDTNIEQKQAKLTQSKNLKKSLMADLLTGKVRVNV